jgi:hypothetical protein
MKVHIVIKPRKRINIHNIPPILRVFAFPFLFPICVISKIRSGEL